MCQPQCISGSFRAARAFALAAACCLGAVSAFPPADVACAQPAGETWRGRSLADGLRALQARGLPVVWSSELVRPELTIPREPTATAPRRILDQLLEPHGLRAEEQAGGILVVVTASPATPGALLVGVTRSRRDLAPLAGVTVRVLGPAVEARSSADGRFAIGELAPGTYTIEARRVGFVPETRTAVAVGGVRPAELDFALQPLPYVEERLDVHPSRLSLLREEPIAPLSLRSSEVEALPHLGGDVFRALSLLPGTSSNDVTSQFSIRGGRRDEVLILLDGQELFDAHHLKEYDNALSVIPEEGLSGLTLTTGNFAASHGDRMGGVLDMTTVSHAGPRHARLSLSVLALVGTSTGTFDDERGSWLASGRLGTIDLANRVFGQEDPSYWDAFGKVERQLGERHRVHAHWLRAGDQLNFEESSVGSDGEVQSSRIDTDYDSSYLWLTHADVLSNRLLLDGALSWSRLEHDRFGDENEEDQGFLVADRRDTEVVRLAQSLGLQALPGHAFEAGFEVRRYQVAYDYQNRSLDLPLRPETVVPLFVERFTGDHLGAFGTYRAKPAPPLTLELGVRYDRHTLTGDTLLSPRINAAWRLSQHDVLRASFGRFGQSQRPYELQVQDGETSFYPLERSRHWLVGYERLLGRRPRSPLQALRVEVYRRDVAEPRPRYENLFEPINSFPEIESGRVRIAPESSRAHGVELVLRGAAGSRVDWWLTYGHARATDQIDNREVPRSIDQPNTVNLHLTSRLGRGLRLSLAWRYHTGWPTTPVSVVERPDEDGELESVIEPGLINSERLSSYHRLDLRLSRQWSLRRGRLMLFFDVQNVYDRNNLAGFDFSLDDETGELSVEEETWPGWFPSLGVAFEF